MQAGRSHKKLDFAKMFWTAIFCAGIGIEEKDYMENTQEIFDQAYAQGRGWTNEDSE